MFPTYQTGNQRSDEETLGIALSERRGIDILFGDIPKSGVVIDTKKEALRIRKNKSSDKNIVFIVKVSFITI